MSSQRPSISRARVLAKSILDRFPPVPRGTLRLTKRLLVDQGLYRSLRAGVPLGPDGSKVPWITFPAVEYLEQIDLTGKQVFEYGSGQSTHWWAQRADHVVALEHDAAWFARVQNELPHNVEYLLMEEEDEYVEAIERRGKFDVIIVDGEWRMTCLPAAIDHLAVGGFVLFDNSDWFPDGCALLRDAGLLQVDFHGFGPCLDTAWTTSLFFDRAAQPTPIDVQPRTPRGGVAFRRDLFEQSVRPQMPGEP